MKSFLFFLPILFLTVAVLNSCDKDDPIIPNEGEVITTFKYTLTPLEGGVPVVLSFQDLDGDGGDEPIISSGILAANTTYSGDIILQNELESPVGDITKEVKEEGDEHQFFFISSLNDLAVTYTDMDVNNRPIGLETTLTTGAVGKGSLTIILRHQPDKDADGVGGGDITNAGGETDIEIAFEIDVQ